MRIYTEGDEQLSSFFLPVIKAKVAAWAERLVAEGKNSGSTSFLFPGSGVSASATYTFGQTDVQIYASAPVATEDNPEEEEVEQQPRTFFVSTTNGYFWVIVSEEYVVSLVSFDPELYPGVELATPGMIAGCFGTDKDSRYVLTQATGIIGATDSVRGQVIMPESIPASSRITPLGDNSYIVAHSAMGKALTSRKITISYDGSIAVDVAIKDVAMQNSINTGELIVATLDKTPCWIHRKCTANYFSPTKTIGYHVDIGSDDDSFGNITAIPGGLQNRQDNRGGTDEYLFNHTADLYRLASLFSHPLLLSENTASFLVVTPTICYDADPSEEKCWGGYYWTAYSSCVEYQSDGNRWVLAPRLVLATVDFDSQSVSFSEEAVSSFSEQLLLWSGEPFGRVDVENQYECGTDEYVDDVSSNQLNCEWMETESGTGCLTEEGEELGLSGSGEYANIHDWDVNRHISRYTREDIKVKRKAFFLFGDEERRTTELASLNGFYFLFDGLFHADVGLQWATSGLAGTGEDCTLCANPPTGQEPGGTVEFRIMAPGHDLMANGVEFVENMEVVSPLGWHNSLYAWYGFIAKVPESLADTHTPVLMTGGVRFTADSVDGRVMECTASLMSAPCVCSEIVLIEEHSSIDVFQARSIVFTGGCPPYRWTAVNGNLGSITRGPYLGQEYVGVSTALTFFPDGDACSVGLYVSDACGNTLSFSDEFPDDEFTVSGPTVLEAGESGTWVISSSIGNYDGLELVDSGGLEVISGVGAGWIFRVPEGGTGTYTATWSGRCGRSCSASVTSLYDEEGYCNYPQCGSVLPQTGDIVAIASPACRPTWQKQCRVVGVWARLSSDCRLRTIPIECCSGTNWWGPVNDHLIATDLIHECRTIPGYFDHVAALTLYTG